MVIAFQYQIYVYITCVYNYKDLSLILWLTFIPVSTWRENFPSNPNLDLLGMLGLIAHAGPAR